MAPKQPATESFPDFAGKLLCAGRLRLRLQECLGTGAYGKVYRALDTLSPSDNVVYYAVKVLRVPKANSLDASLQDREFRHHKRVGEHPNIISFIDVVKENEFIYVVLELCDGGDLFEAIVTNNVFYQRDDLIKSSFLQLIDAISYCHQNSVYHRDIKPENILCSQDGSSLYVADFGLSTDVPLSRDFRCGSVEYMSPDCIGRDFKFKGRAYSTRCNDIWALGVVLVNMITQRTPWNAARCDDDCFKAYLNDEDYFLRVLAISEGTNRILKRVFRIDPLARISLSELRREIMAIDSFFPPCADPAKLSPVLASSDSPRNSAALRRSFSSTPSIDIGSLTIDSEGCEMVVPLGVPNGFLTLPAAAHSGSSLASSADSEGPITPETHPIHVEMDVPDMEDGEDLGEALHIEMHVKPTKPVEVTLPKKVFFRRFIEKLKVSS